MQVTILERGGAIVQYQPSIDEAGLAALETLAGTGTVIAPGANLPAPVIATAWTWKLSCGQVDLDALAEFTRTRVLDSPGRD